MVNFSELKCGACRAGAPPASPEEVDEFKRNHTGWEILEVDGVPRLIRGYVFSNFLDALAFTNRVAQIAEEHGHHPALLTEWGKVTVSWWTHKILDLHRNDLIMGAKTDDLYEMVSL